MILTFCLWPVTRSVPLKFDSCNPLLANVLAYQKAGERWKYGVDDSSLMIKTSFLLALFIDFISTAFIHKIHGQKGVVFATL